MGQLEQRDLTETLSYFWHPVCTIDDVGADPSAVTLLGRELVIARLADRSWAALDDRCAHRSTRLSVGTVDGCELRCAYHGWTFANDGSCTSIPSLPDGPIPTSARVGAYDVVERYGLIWVRLERPPDGIAEAAIPHSSAFDAGLHTIVGEPYTWPVSPLRRVENFVDLAHFAWVHDGSLGSRDDPIPPLPDIERHATELRFTYEPPDFDADGSAMYGTSHYRVGMPCTVDIDFRLSSGARRVLWMTASPVDESTCRVFWAMARDDDLDAPGERARDDEHIAFQQLVLGEDEPVVCAQTPGSFPLDPAAEVSVSTDLVSNVYRRWLRELVRSYADGGVAALADAAVWTSAATYNGHQAGSSQLTTFGASPSRS